MAADLQRERVPGVSRTTVYNAFSSLRLPMPGVVDAIVVHLAVQVRNVTPEQVDRVSIHFDNLWYLAETEARSYAAARTAPPRSETAGAARTAPLHVGSLGAPRRRLAIEPVRLRSRLDALREAFGDAEVSEAVIAHVSEAIHALPDPRGAGARSTPVRRAVDARSGDTSRASGRNAADG
ncbi:hypothetical protein ACGFYZ_20505 [Streptomyces sp. NPDC048330]|uniref:hypothetical protein n=1 Tax=Streptomyces sp. NPDC048330 TaxID=3365533 RepID=UPI003710877C